MTPLTQNCPRPSWKDLPCRRSTPALGETPERVWWLWFLAWYFLFMYILYTPHKFELMFEHSWNVLNQGTRGAPSLDTAHKRWFKRCSLYGAQRCSMTVTNKATRSYVSTSWAYPLTAATLEQAQGEWVGNKSMLERKLASCTALLSMPFPHTPCSGNNGSLPYTSAGIDRNNTCNSVQAHVWSWNGLVIENMNRVEASCLTSNSLVPTGDFNTWIMESWAKELPIFCPTSLQVRCGSSYPAAWRGQVGSGA